jgi:hypothetical protein
LNWKKVIITGTLATTLTFSSMSALAVSFDDVSSNETSISKLVALGIVVNAGANFNPEKGLTRQEFAEIAGRIMTVQAGKTVKLKDTKNAAAIKAVGAGILTVGKSGDFKPKNAITYSDLARGLAFGLGFKASWTNDLADYLYFLERKGVLSIDTDLDAVVTREDAAVAIDNYMKAKESYTISTGIVDRLQGNLVVIKTESGNKSYKISSNATVFLDGQKAELSSVAKATKIHLTLNKKGEVAYAEGNSLEMFDGKLGYSGGSLTLNGAPKNFLLNGLVSSLPNSPTVPFTFTEFTNYASKAGVSFDGGMYGDTVTDEITILDAYITKVAKREVTVEANKVVFDFKDVALKAQSFSFTEDAKFTLLETVKDAEGKDSTVVKEVNLADIVALQAAGKKFTGVLTAGPDGLATSIEFAEKVEEKK